MRSHCTARRQVNSRKPIDHWKFPFGKVPGNSSGKFKCLLQPTMSTFFFCCKFTNNLRTECSLYSRMLLVDVPVSIGLSIESVINHIIGVPGNILSVGAGIFAVVCAVVLVVIVVFVIHIVVVFDLRCKGTALLRTQCSHSMSIM